MDLILIKVAVDGTFLEVDVSQRAGSCEPLWVYFLVPAFLHTE